MGQSESTMSQRSFAMKLAATCVGTAFLLVGPLARTRAQAAGDEESVVVEVNGTPIYRRAVRDVVKGVVAASPRIPSSSEIDSLTQDALNSLIDLELLYQEALARKVQVSQEDVDAEIEQTEQQFEDEDDFAAALHQEGLTEAQLRQDTRKTLLVNRLLETVVWRDVRVSEAAIKAFYAENQKVLGDSARLRLRHILVRVPEGAPPQSREDALVKAKGLREQLVAGADFAQMAREKSEDPNTAPQGGELGVRRSNAPGPLTKAAQTLAPGEISAVVESPAGYHIVQVVERTEGPTRELDAEMRSRIAQVLEEEEKLQRQNDFVAELRKKAKITFITPTPAPTDQPKETPSAHRPEVHETPPSPAGET